MFPFLGDRKTSFKTKLISEFLLVFKIMFGHMELFSINVGDGVSNNMYMQMVSVLVYTD